MIRHDAEPRAMFVLLILFVGSGCAALIYETVWFQLLPLVIGSSAFSLGVLLGTFMGGMCLGSLLLPRLVSSRLHPLRIYAVLEVGIGLLGLAVLFGAPFIEGVYVRALGHGMPALMVRAVVAGICLLPPAMLMGATLPAIARWVQTTPTGIAWLGFFYGGNIAGAVGGAVLGGFYLLRVYDMATATYVAVCINFAMGAIAYALSLSVPFSDPQTEPSAGSAPAPVPRLPGSAAVYLVITISGFTALSAEVIWTRLLSLMLGATVYTFSIILAVFLLGLGIGSAAGSLLARRSGLYPRLALGCCQLALAVAIAWAAYLLTEALPFRAPIRSMSGSPWFVFQVMWTRCAWAILPAAILWGASFPLALAAVAAPGQDGGRLVGGVYAANTIGAIAGAVLTSMLLIWLLGSHQVQRLMVFLCVAGAAIMLLPAIRALPLRMAATVSGGVAILAGLLIWSISPVPDLLIAWGRHLPAHRLEMRDGRLKDHSTEILYAREGLNAAVAVTERRNGWRFFHVSGRIEASSDPIDMRLQRLLAHVPALLHPKPRSVLVVGCGSGMTAGSFLIHPDVEDVVICEIEPLIPEVVAQYFGKENYGVVAGITRNNNVRYINGKRVEVIFEDARHYILTAKRKFDVITSDPIHPWIRGSATLYTEEYFRECLRHLNPGGIIGQWVPLYESTPDVVRSEFATFFKVFPHGTAWSSLVEGQGYDIVLTAQVDPARIEIDQIHDRLRRPEYQTVAKSLEEVGYPTPMHLLATYAGRASDLKQWLSGAQINHDSNLRLQYLAGMGFNSYQGADICSEIFDQRDYPEDLFVSADVQKVAMLREVLKRRAPGL